jgi:hypothetical protein
MNHFEDPAPEIVLVIEIGREISLTITGDGLCVMFADQGDTGIGLDEFEEFAKLQGFDTTKIVTTL